MIVKPMEKEVAPIALSCLEYYKYTLEKEGLNVPSHSYIIEALCPRGRLSVSEPPYCNPANENGVCARCWDRPYEEAML